MELTHLFFAGFTVTFAFMVLMYNSMQSGFSRIEKRLESLDEKLSGKIEKLDEKLSYRIESLDSKLSARIESLDNKLSGRIEKLDDKSTDIDRRLSRIEGALSVRDHCPFNHEIKKEAV